jgi:hypothetical protein
MTGVDWGGEVTKMAKVYEAPVDARIRSIATRNYAKAVNS